MAGYTKLFSSIVASTIWREPKETKVVWITLLAMANAQGRVDASLPGLADMARVTMDECQGAIKTLEGPDVWSRSQEFEGRRIEPVPGGWMILNYAKYREERNPEVRREQNREAQKRFRAKSKPVSQSKPKVSHDKPPSAQAEAEAEAGNTIAPSARERNPLFDALLTAEGIPLTEVGNAGGRIAAALKTIKDASPDVTPDEVTRRAKNYTTHFPSLSVTANGLAKNWGKSHEPKSPLNGQSGGNSRQFSQRNDYSKITNHNLGAGT